MGHYRGRLPPLGLVYQDNNTPKSTYKVAFLDKTFFLKTQLNSKYIYWRSDYS
jgi:hypothetical protein